MWSILESVFSVRVAVTLAVGATILLAGATLLTARWRGAAASVRHLIWQGAFGAVLTMALGAIALPPIPLPIRTPAPPPTSAATTDARTPSGASETTITIDHHSATGPTTTVTVSPTPMPGALTGVTPARWVGWPVVMVLWAIGTVLLLARLAIGSWRVHRALGALPDTDDGSLLLHVQQLARRLGVARPIRLRCAPRDHVPLTAGVLWPVVVLPPSAATWPAEQRDAVLLHELGHVQRFDVLSIVVAQLVLALTWWHPLVWWATARARDEAERACDDVVLTGGVMPSTYARTLVTLTQSLDPAPRAGQLALAMAESSQLATRVEAILDPTPARERLSPARRGIAVILALAAAPVAALTPVDRPITSSMASTETQPPVGAPRRPVRAERPSIVAAPPDAPIAAATPPIAPPIDRVPPATAASPIAPDVSGGAPIAPRAVAPMAPQAGAPLPPTAVAPIAPPAGAPTAPQAIAPTPPITPPLRGGAATQSPPAPPPTDHALRAWTGGSSLPWTPCTGRREGSSTSHSQRTGERDAPDEISFTHSDPAGCLRLLARGDVALTDDGLDVRPRSDEAAFAVEWLHDGVRTGYLRMGAHTTVQLRGTSPVALDAPEARAVRRAMLDRAWRATAFGAARRVAFLRTQGGTAALFAEVDRMTTTPAQVALLRAILATPLAPADLPRALEAVQQLESQDDRADFLHELLPRLAPEQLPAVARSVGTLRDADDAARLLHDLLDRWHDAPAMRPALRAAIAGAGRDEAYDDVRRRLATLDAAIR